MQTSNIWNNPAGYHRTSKNLQYLYLKSLLERGSPSGHILDVGCGTGNALQLLNADAVSSYTGIDISRQMLTIAQGKSTEFVSKFIQRDFLLSSISTKFDHVICAACLHWFHPNQENVVQKIYELLHPGGMLHLSTALSFHFLKGEERVQRKIIDQVRKKYDPIEPIDLFSSRRLQTTEISQILKKFEIKQISLHEQELKFDSYEDFKDWHTGSGSVVEKQFAPAHAIDATNMYYELLFDAYMSNKHSVCYATALVNAEKIRE